MEPSKERGAGADPGRPGRAARGRGKGRARTPGAEGAESGRGSRGDAPDSPAPDEASGDAGAPRRRKKHIQLPVTPDLEDLVFAVAWKFLVERQLPSPSVGKASTATGTGEPAPGGDGEIPSEPDAVESAAVEATGTEPLTVETIADWASQELRARGKDFIVSRQDVYPILAEAIRLEFVRFSPPLHAVLRQRLADLCHVGLESISVVNSTGPSTIELVCQRAAEMTRDLIAQVARETGSPGRPAAVHLGLGSGWTTMLVSKFLGKLLRSEAGLIPIEELVVHSMNCGFLPDQPESSAVSFFSFFADVVVPRRFVGLFAEPFVDAGEFARIVEHPAVGEVFSNREQINVVVTSLGSPRDADSLLNRFETMYLRGKGFRPSSARASRVGDVQYRPYSATGPILEQPGEGRPVTLFELEELARSVRERKRYVLLVSGPTRNREEPTRTDALLPLLAVPALRVWSHLCLDVQTAREAVERLPALLRT